MQTELILATPVDRRQQFAEDTSSPERGNRSPERWAPRNFTIPAIGPGVPSNGAVQIAGAAIGRKAIAIQNTGANPLLLRQTADFNRPFWTIMPTPVTGCYLYLETEGEMWVSSVIGTTCDVLETWYDLVLPHHGELVQGSLEAVIDSRTLDDGANYPETPMFPTFLPSA